MCKALSHPARIRILRHLLEVDQCICGEIVEILPLAQSTVSQHLKSLKKAGLIRGEVEGPSVCYCADHDVLAIFRKMANAPLRPFPPTLKRETEHARMLRAGRKDMQMLRAYHAIA